jgi:hypothetical protein
MASITSLFGQINVYTKLNATPEIQRAHTSGKNKYSANRDECVMPGQRF